MTRANLFFITILFSVSALAQSIEPFEYYDSYNSGKLVSELKKQGRVEKREASSFNEYFGYIYKESTKQIVSLVENEHIIWNDSLSSWINIISESLISSNPSIKPPGKIMIKRDGFSNAINYIDGTIIINLGLIARASSEDEIAFVLAHEIAHHHLDHILERAKAFLRRGTTIQVQMKLKKITEGNMDLEDLEFVQLWFNSMFKNSRDDELQADSLAIVMIRNSKFDLKKSYQALNNIEDPAAPIFPLKSSLFDELIFKGLPFKKRWLKPREIGHNDSFIELIVNNDSLISHPDIDIRKSKFVAYEPGIYENHRQKISSNPKVELEMLRSFEFYNKYDFGIHMALQLKPLLENNSYINYQIGKMLFEIAMAKNDNRLNQFVSPITDYYPPETKALNNFFYNLTIPEAAEISYLFVKKNFDSKNPDHYRNLHNCTQLTMRLQEAKSIKKAFKKRFPGERFSKYSDE